MWGRGKNAGEVSHVAKIGERGGVAAVLHHCRGGEESRLRAAEVRRISKVDGWLEWWARVVVQVDSTAVWMSVSLRQSAAVPDLHAEH